MDCSWLLKGKNMLIGYKLKCDENGKFDLKEYEKMAQFCIQNGLAIKDCRPEYFEIIESPKPTAEQLKQTKIAELKANLSATDYAIIKIAEKAATPEEYADVIEQRRAWRLEINTLEEEQNVND